MNRIKTDRALKYLSIKFGYGDYDYGLFRFKNDLEELIAYIIEIIIMVAIAVAFVVIMFYGLTLLPDNPRHGKYELTCINGVEYIENRRSKYVPLIPSYKPDGTINECEVSDEQTKYS